MGLSTPIKQAALIEVVDEELRHRPAGIDDDPLAAVPLGDLLELVAVLFEGREIPAFEVLGLGQQLIGHSKLDAVRAAAQTRFRPILMTTVATISGHFPLTLVTGPGAIARNSIVIVLVGGLAIGTLFTLFVVPSVYILIARTHHRTGEAGEPEPSPDPVIVETPPGGLPAPTPAE